MKKTLAFLLLILLAACSATPTVVVPTLQVLPSLTPSPTLAPSDLPTLTAPPSATTVPSSTASETATLVPTNTETPTLTPSLTFTPSNTVTETPTATETASFTPSLTITNTVTPTPSPSFTASPELDSLGMLALLSERATVLPPEMLYNPPTLTAVAYAAQTLVAASSAPAPPADAGLATLPPPNVVCAAPPPDALSAADPALTGSLGCPTGQVFTTTTAVQSFEHGSMIYVQGSPGSIYVLTLDGRFRRFDDTWVSGVDPETGGETPPLGMIEPKRGFGKVWRANLDVRGSLGWGITEEEGASSALLLFERGRAVFLPQRGETYLLIDDPGGATGSWRTLPASF